MMTRRTPSPTMDRRRRGPGPGSRADVQRRYAAPSLPQPAAQQWRSRFIYGAVGLAFLALAARSVYLQTASQPFLQAKGAQTYERTLALPAWRGRILDRNGVVLASSLQAHTIAVFPRQMDLSDARVMDLARLLSIDPMELSNRITQSDTYFTLRHQVDPETAERIRALRIRGVVIEPGYRRVYPQGEMTAQLVGFTNFDQIGQEGLELSFQQYLTGKPGSRRVVRDGAGQVIAALDANAREPQDGQDLSLTIDRRIQSQTFAALEKVGKAFDAKSAAAVVVDTKTGEVLALANWPSFDPNDRSNLSGEQLRNRALTDAFEPGSTIKPFTAAMALESGRFRPQSVIDVTEGKLRVGRDTIHDAHRNKMPLTLEQVVQKSSNVGIAKVALELPAERLGSLLDEAGFGHAPKLGFPGASSGRLRDASRWKPIEHVTISYGHGLSVSLMQLAQAYTIFAGRGDLKPLTLFRPPEQDLPVRTYRVSSHASAVRDEVHGAQVIRPETAAAMRRMLEMAVQKEGTSPEARIDGYRVGGKTGTAHKLQDGRYVDRYVSSFVGLAPMSDPRIAVAVMVDDPKGKRYYGGQVAGPVFASIASDALRILRVEPDAPFTTLYSVPALEEQARGQGDRTVATGAKTESDRQTRPAKAAAPALVPEKKRSDRGPGSQDRNARAGNAQDRNARTGNAQARNVRLHETQPHGPGRRNVQFHDVKSRAGRDRLAASTAPAVTSASGERAARIEPRTWPPQSDHAGKARQDAVRNVASPRSAGQAGTDA